MMNISPIAFLALLLVAACSAPPSEEASRSDMDGLRALLPGEYSGMGGKGPVYHSIAQLQVPQFGGKVFYHHISTISPRGPAVQRKIYAFDEGGNRMGSTVVLGSGAVFEDAESMAEALNALPEKQLLRFPDGCKFQWQRAGDDFVAQVSRETCSYESPAFGGLVSPEMTYTLSRCGLDIQEGIYRQDGSPVFPPSAINAKRVNAATGC